MKGEIEVEVKLSVVKKKRSTGLAELRFQQCNLFIFCQVPYHDSSTHLWTQEGQHGHICLPNGPSMVHPPPRLQSLCHDWPSYIHVDNKLRDAKTPHKSDKKI